MNINLKRVALLGALSAGAIALTLAGRELIERIKDWNEDQWDRLIDRLDGDELDLNLPMAHQPEPPVASAAEKAPAGTNTTKPAKSVPAATKASGATDAPPATRRSRQKSAK